MPTRGRSGAESRGSSRQKHRLNSLNSMHMQRRRLGLLAYEIRDAPGSQTGSGYEQLGSNSGLGSEVCSWGKLTAWNLKRLKRSLNSLKYAQRRWSLAADCSNWRKGSLRSGPRNFNVNDRTMAAGGVPPYALAHAYSSRKIKRKILRARALWQIWSNLIKFREILAQAKSLYSARSWFLN